MSKALQDTYKPFTEKFKMPNTFEAILQYKLTMHIEDYPKVVFSLDGPMGGGDLHALMGWRTDIDAVEEDYPQILKLLGFNSKANKVANIQRQIKELQTQLDNLNN